MIYSLLYFVIALAVCALVWWCCDKLLATTGIPSTPRTIIRIIVAIVLVIVLVKAAMGLVLAVSPI